MSKLYKLGDGLIPTFNWGEFKPLQTFKEDHKNVKL